MSRVAACLGLALSFLASCRRPPATDSDLARFAPSDSLAVAIVRIDAIRPRPAFARWLDALPDEIRRDAVSALVAWNGRDFLLAAHGQFPKAPAGAFVPRPGIVVLGPFRAGEAASALGARLDDVPRDSDVRAAVRGDLSLPLSGNLANLNRLLHMTQTTSVGLRLGETVDATALARCRDENEAANLEQTVTAMLLLAGSRADSMQVSRSGPNVMVRASMPAADVARLLPQR